ncbi:MAG TPA: hypothetical protein VGR37_13350 [Longimicrobiaceae bacterium]|nr:hypothetical protein [Longimicrobiaceae bacterium]
MRVKTIAAAVLSAGVVGCTDAPTHVAPPTAERAASYAWNPSTPLPAFPGAEGFGAYTTHGRGGQVVKVTNLNDRGPGSLRAAVEGNGLPARIVVFEVGGVIQLESPIVIRSGRLYVAGQTAPGDGITLKGAQLSVQASDVVVRYLRTRPGDEPLGAGYDGRDGIHVLGSSSRHLRNIIFDHISSSWSVDENMTIWPGGSSGRIENVTFQWSIVSESLYRSFHGKGAHSMGMLVGEGSRNITIHHNLLAHNNQRNPRIKQDVLNADVVNNVMYNWGDFAAEVGESLAHPPTTVNFVGNFWKAGENSPLPTRRREVRVKAMPVGSGIYFEGNYGPSRPFSGTQRPGQELAAEWAVSDIEQRYPTELERYVSAVRFTHAPVREERADLAYTLVLAKAGATVPFRDAVDERVIGEVRRGRGAIIDSQAQVGGWPEYRVERRPEGWDTDGDGMPDAWEAEHGLDPSDPSDGSQDRDGDGYTNLEEYLSSLVD